MPKIVGLDPTKERTYVAKCEQELPKDEQTVYKVRMLRLHEAANIKDDIYRVTGLGKERKETLRTGSIEVEVLKTCMLGWENFKSDEGKDVPFNLENIDWIPAEVRSEISDFCSGERVEEKEAKN